MGNRDQARQGDPTQFLSEVWISLRILDLARIFFYVTSGGRANRREPSMGGGRKSSDG